MTLCACALSCAAACGLRQIQSGNLVSWRFTFPSAFSYLCPSDASQPSALLALTPSSSGFTAVVNQGNTLYSLLAFNVRGLKGCVFVCE